MFLGLCFTPKLPKNAILPRVSSLGAILATFTILNVANKSYFVLAQPFCSTLNSIVYKLYFLGTNLFISRSNLTPIFDIV